MQTENYRNWLATQNYQGGTITAQMHRAGRVEDYYGDLDALYAEDRLESLIQELTYTTQDRRNNRPNESKIPFEGNAYNNLASYRDAIRRYRRFLEDDIERIEPEDVPVIEMPEPYVQSQTIGLEKDMQAAIRQNIGQIETGLRVTDNGRERSVETGFIDITAEDSNSVPVVIELKTGVAGQRAVAQILSYIGSVMEEEGNDQVRGILIASEFDRKARAAAKVVPNLTLMRYQFSFQFIPE
ncbi:endonuclease NucS domain-containing protein [Pseudoalteromonas sp. P1-11]|uniref:endonuclease NucS domain-containing protein n=1 Tax=Pseudoalteromonas sp. P1-11 TaxID=1715254 RepID=UPI0006DCFB9C|nr:endonuclease NucS domain-containing protein [Pseudoalteromonas sp. P1-11]KPW02266.1 Endonuclease NucS [Pseudoalteromonas sp. P1-11]